MRPRFSDNAHLQREAQRDIHSGLGRLKRWWSNKWKRPLNHPLLLGQTVAQLLTEFYADLYEEKEEIERRLENPDGDTSKLRERLRSITAFLGEEAPDVADDLIDRWERELAAGKTPDLGMLPAQAKKR
jgi:hypothetical protein